MDWQQGLAKHVFLGGVSGGHLLLPLLNSFNKTGAAIFFMQATLPGNFPFFQMDF